MCVGDAQDAQDDAVRALASGRNFFFGDVVHIYLVSDVRTGSVYVESGIWRVKIQSCYQNNKTPSIRPISWPD